jgi:hypothetical protein
MSQRSLKPPAMFGRMLVKGAGAFEALIIAPSMLTTISRLLERMAVPRVQTTSLSLPVIQSLENFAENVQGPYLVHQLSMFRTSLQQVNLCVFRAPNCVRVGHKINTGSGKTSLHPIFGGLRYRHHC